MSGERDRKFELALKHELRKAGAPPLGSLGEGGCVDAETLGAWADGGLDAAQMSIVEVHVSSCARCQAIVGAAVRSAPVAAVTTGRAFWFPKWAIAPLAAAAALTIWMVVPQETMQAPPAPSRVAAPRDNAAVKKDVEPPARDAALQQQAKESGVVGESKPAAAVAGKLAEGKRERADAPAAPPAPPEAMLQKSARLASTPIEIASPDPTSRWRIVNNSIERSEDAGSSWIPIRAAGGELLTAGISPSRSVCWLIGSNGLVMVTADGVAFARVPLPEAVDLVTITATDARIATVTTADGRRFRTDDSGRTWRQN